MLSMSESLVENLAPEVKIGTNEKDTGVEYVEGSYIHL